MKKGLKITLIVVAVILVLILIGGGVMWYFMGQPLYSVGMVRNGENLSASLTPPSQTSDAEFWQMEPGVRLYKFSKGRGRPILIIHGGPGYPYREPWPGLQSLTDRFQFYYYDQRGCGKSSRPIDRFSSSNYYGNMKQLDQALGIGAQLADVERIRHILGENKLVIIGHSFGGFLASLYAAEFPKKVDSLILIAPANVLVMPQEGGGDLFQTVRDRLPESEKTKFDDFLKRYLDFKSIFSQSEQSLVNLNNEFGKYYGSVLNVTLPEQGSAGGWMVHAMYFSMGMKHDYRAALKVVNAPVLVIHGTEDLQTEAASRLYVEAFSQAEFKTIKDATHFPFVEQPEQFSQLVSAFL